MEDEETGPNQIHFLKKPLFYWTKSFVENEVQREDTLTKFLGSDALNYVLDYIGIEVELDQSSLHLSSIFDEDGNQSSAGASLTSVTSARSKYSTNQYETELRQRITKFNGIFNDLRSYYEDHFNQLVTTRPPNSLHIATACNTCAIPELEQILTLILGAAIQGKQKHETIRRIRAFPTQVQEQLIEYIKQISDSPDLHNVKPWSEFSTLPSSEQKVIYESLLGHLRRLIFDRNNAVQSRFSSDYLCGLTNCEQRREGHESLDFDKFSEERSSSAPLRQLREELLEKSDLLKECRDELEMTQSKLEEVQNELSESQSQLKTFKKTRDEFDILIEGHSKAVRLEAEIIKMKKKLEEAEQYYERVEILQNENRSYQRKLAILMDQLNLLTVEKERLELSFMTHSNHRSPRSLLRSEDEDESRLTTTTPRKVETFPEELFLDSDDEKVVEEKKVKEIETQTEETHSIDNLILEPKIELNSTESPSVLIISNSESSLKDAEIQDEKEDSEILKGRRHSSNQTKRNHRRAHGLYGKRNKKSLFFPQSKVLLQKVNNFSSFENLNSPSHFEDSVDSSEPLGKTRPNKKSHRRATGNHKKSRHALQIERDLTPPPLPSRRRASTLEECESDADEELSMSPNPQFPDSSDPEKNLNPEIPFHHANMVGRESDHGESEVFFICSTSAPPPMARNVRIYAPPRDERHTQVLDPTARHTEFYYSPQSQREHMLSPILNSAGQNPARIESPELTPSPEGGGMRYSIDVNVHHGNRHELSLLQPRHEAYVEESVLRSRPNGLIGNFESFGMKGNTGSSSEDDDDSVWYEYGCV